MKGVERWEAEAVGALEIMKELSHELWRLSRMSLVPVACNNQKVGAEQSQVAIWHRLIDDDLRTRGIDYASAPSTVSSQTDKPTAALDKQRSGSVLDKKTPEKKHLEVQNVL